MHIAVAIAVIICCSYSKTSNYVNSHISKDDQIIRNLVLTIISPLSYNTHLNNISISSSSNKYYDTLQQSISSACYKTLLSYGSLLESKEPDGFSLRILKDMIDFSGKFPSISITSGNIISLGSFDDCISLHPKYLTYSLTFIDASIFNPALTNAFEAYKNKLPLLLWMPGATYQVGWCLPASCDQFDVKAIAEIAVLQVIYSDSFKLFTPYYLGNVSDMGKILKTVSVYKIITHTQDLTLQLVPENVNRAAGYSSWLKGKHQKYVKRRSRDLIFGVAFFSIFGAILLFIYLKERRDFVTNLHSKPRSASRGNNFFRALPTLSQCFSPRQNLLKILRGGPSYINSNNVSNSPDSASSNSTHPSEPLGNGYNYESARGIAKTSQNVIKSPLTFLTGVRALSTLHVMYGHTYVFSLFFVSNFEHVMKGMKGRFYHHSFGHLNSSLITPTDAGKNILPRDHDDNDPILNLNRFDSFFVFMYCAFFAVDSFFLFSGLLSSAFTPILSQLSKHANQITLNSLIRSYPAPLIYRYIRLTPVYAAVLVFEIFVSPYIGNGPYWASEGVDPDCRSLWWTNLAYVNNYFTTGHRTASGKLDGKVRMCMPWAWYLACDFQFHLVSPLIIFALIKFSAPASSQKRGKGLKLNLKRLGIISACFIGLLVALSFCISYYNRYKVLVFIDNTNTMKFFAEFYIRPYIRIPPFFLGLLLGCYLKLRASADNKDDQCSTSHDIVDKTSDNAPNVNPLVSKSRSVFRPYIIVAFLTLVAAVSAKLYGLFPNFDRYYKSSIFRPGRWDAFRSSPQFPEVMEALFLSLSRFLWPLLLILFLAFMILDWPDDPPFKCVAGTMRLVKRGLNSFLSHEAWIPVSNLSYSAYLIHPVIMLIHLRTLRYPLYFSHTNFFVHFVFYSVATFATSLFFSLAFELPFINLAKIVFQRLN